MNGANIREPHLHQLYHRYLADEHSANFIAAVSQRYTMATLLRLATSGSRITRRSAILALSFLAGFEANDVLGRALHDADRGVRMLAENGIRDVWCRAGSPWQRRCLARIVRLNASNQFDEVIRQAGKLIDEAPWFAEAWNQRAIAYYHLEQYEDSANDCLQTLELNGYHFGAAVGMGHCYLEMDDPVAALQNFRRALRLHPGLEGVRAQVDYLQRTLEEK